MAWLSNKKRTRIINGGNYNPHTPIYAQFFFLAKKWRQKTRRPSYPKKSHWTVHSPFKAFVHWKISPVQLSPYLVYFPWCRAKNISSKNICNGKLLKTHFLCTLPFTPPMYVIGSFTMLVVFKFRDTLF